MQMSRRTLAAAAVAVATGVTGRADAEGVQTAPERLNAPGAEGRLIAARAGLWDVTETAWSKPGATPVVTTGAIAERTMIGNLLQEIIRSGGPGPGAAVDRMDLLTYNRLEGRRDYVSFDTRTPVGLMPAWSSGSADESQINLSFAPFAIPASAPEPIGELLRMEQRIRFLDRNSDSKDQYFELANGGGQTWLAHRYVYVRRT